MRGSAVAFAATISALATVALTGVAGAAPPNGPAISFLCGDPATDVVIQHPPGVLHTPGAPASVWVDGRHYVLIELHAPWIDQTYGVKTGLVGDTLTCTSPDGVVTGVLAPVP